MEIQNEEIAGFDFSSLWKNLYWISFSFFIQKYKMWVYMIVRKLNVGCLKEGRKTLK